MKRALLVILMAAMGAAVAADDASIRLRAKAEVSDAVIRLKDVAGLAAGSGAVDEELANIELAPAAAPGRSVQLTLAEVRKQLFIQRVNMAQVSLCGASVIEVRRVVNTGETVGRNDTLAKRVRAGVLKAASEKMGRSEEELNVEVVEFEGFAIPADAKITVSAPQPVELSQEAVYAATAEVAGEEVASFDVTARLGGVKKVVVAARSLAAGTVLGEKDVEIRLVNASEAGDGALGDAQEIIGQRLARRVVKGEALTGGDIAKAVMVRRGDTCKMVVVGRGFHVIAEARARESGAMGEDIEMESLKTRKRFSAVVTGTREVQFSAQEEER